MLPRSAPSVSIFEATTIAEPAVAVPAESSMTAALARSSIRRIGHCPYRGIRKPPRHFASKIKRFCGDYRLCRGV